MATIGVFGIGLGALASPAAAGCPTVYSCGTGFWTNASDCESYTFWVAGEDLSGSGICFDSNTISIEVPNLEDPAIITIGSPNGSIPSAISITGASFAFVAMDEMEPLGGIGSGGISAPNAAITGLIDGDVDGEIDARQIGHAGTFDGLEIGGDVNADIDLSGTPVSIVAGDQLNLLEIDGDLGGDIDADEGNVGVVVVTGAIGSPTSLVSLAADGDIDVVQAGEIHAVITAADSISEISALGNATEGSVTYSGSGDLRGEIIADDISAASQTPGILAARDAIGTAVSDDWSFAEIPDLSGHQPSIRIGRTLDSSLTIATSNGDLAGEILVNTNDDSMDPGGWDGSVKVGSTTLSPPYYSETTATLGGGAVGLVPYRLHRDDCDPPHDSTVIDVYLLEIQGFETVCVYQGFETIGSFYGPVEYVGSGDPFTVQLKDDDTYQTVGWGDLEMVADGDSRRFSIERDSGQWPAGEYRIFANVNDLDCRYAPTGTKVSTTDAYYEFEIADCGQMLLQTFDCNGDQELCPEDMATWASYPQDFNGDSSTDATDLVILENAIDSWNSN